MSLDTPQGGQFALDMQGLQRLKHSARQDPSQGVRGAAEQFEALFIQMMLKSMRDAVPTTGLIDSQQTEFYQSMLDQQWSQTLATRGIGLADSLVAQLERSGMAPSPPSDSGVDELIAGIPRGAPRPLQDALRPDAEDSPDKSHAAEQAGDVSASSTAPPADFLEAVETVYSPGRLSRSVALEHVEESKIGDLDFPMTRDPDELRSAWKEAAAEIADEAREEDVAFVTLGDPNVYSTFGHLRRTLEAFHPDVDLEVVPGVSAMTAFATALGVEIESGTGLALREAANGAAPTGPDRMVLFKVTDAPTTHEKLTEAGYDVRFGRRLFMEQGETIVTEDPSEIDERDYYTLAYAEKQVLKRDLATAEFDVEDADPDAEADDEAEAKAEGSA
ncbi:MAG: cobalt-factor II C(20)-methyltransferase [Halomonas sp.]